MPSRLGWLLPGEPDVMGMLREQAAVTTRGMTALIEWAAGDAAATERIRATEHEADEIKRNLRLALRDSFVTPIAQEDIYVLSERLDKVLTDSKDAVREAEIMEAPPDDAVVEMTRLIAEGVEHICVAFDRLANESGEDREHATDAADRAHKAQRQVEKVYRTAMSRLLSVQDLREVMARRELYRRFSRISETVIELADRVWYASVKEL